MKYVAVSPPMSGPDVLSLQKELTALGMSPGRLDGKYGAATAAAVARFKLNFNRADIGDGNIDELGICDDITRDQIRQIAKGGVVAPVSESMLGKMALERAITCIGEKESPPQSNETRFGEWFGINGVKWCGIFISYCFAEGASYIICDGIRGAGVRKGKGCSYVPTIEAWLRSTGQWIGGSDPLPGDIVIFPDSHHIGLVKSNIDKKFIYTVEGNTSVSSDSDGGEVQKRKREIAKMRGFGRIRSQPAL